MDDVVNRFARELADAIAAAVAENPQVEACREKARAAGFEMKVTLEAVVGFVSRSQSAALTKVTAPARVVQPKRSLEVTANDRRFLRSLRIAADETAEPVGVFESFDRGAQPGWVRKIRLRVVMLVSHCPHENGTALLWGAPFKGQEVVLEPGAWAVPVALVGLVPKVGLTQQSHGRVGELGCVLVGVYDPGGLDDAVVVFGRRRQASGVSAANRQQIETVIDDGNVVAERIANRDRKAATMDCADRLKVVAKTSCLDEVAATIFSAVRVSGKAWQRGTEFGRILRRPLGRRLRIEIGRMGGGRITPRRVCLAQTPWCKD